MGLLALAIAPGIAICLFVYFKDKHNREPLSTLVITFILGMLSILPALVFELLLGKQPEQLAGSSMAYVALFAYCIVAFSEEVSKFLVVRFYSFRRKAFDEPFDGIIYAVVASMGFATLENIMYVTQNGFVNGIVRMFLSVPAHATFGVLMGYFISLAKFGKPAYRRINFVLALVMPILFHGTFDFFLFIDSSALHVGGALASFIIGIVLSFKAIKKKRALSEAYVKQMLQEAAEAGAVVPPIHPADNPPPPSLN